jgi:oxalate decarboxylase/phosphoglucose isomerase-like protein (cupin superfamily)
MKTLKLAFVLTAALPLAASAQDVVKVDPAHYKVLVDNASVRVLKVDFPVGAKSPMHSHPDAMLVALGDAKATFTFPDGKTQDVELKNEAGLYTPAFTHAPANTGTTPVDAILVEFKAKAPGTATLPAQREGMQMTTLAEGPRAVAIKSTAGPDFHEPAGSTHEFDQVVIALGAADMSLAVEGKPPVTKWKRGDVQFIGRGVKHEAKNTSGKPVEFAIVAVK